MIDSECVFVCVCRRMGMQLPGAWPAQPQLPSTQLASAVAAQGAALQQPTPGMMAYPAMQQFQVHTHLPDNPTHTPAPNHRGHNRMPLVA